MTRCFGDFERGGELTYWPDDDGRKLLEDLRENRSVTVDTRNNFTLFDGRRAHRVAAFTGGDRYSLVFSVCSRGRLGRVMSYQKAQLIRQMTPSDTSIG